MALQIPRFQQLAPLVDERGLPTQAFHIWWDRVASGLESQLTDITSALADIAQLQSDMNDRITEIATAQEIGLEYMKDISDVTINTSYTGTVDPVDQLPKNIPAKRFNNATDKTTSSSWSRALISGDASTTMDSGTGVLTLTAITATSIIEVTSTRTIGGNVIALSKRFTIFINQADAPISASTGGGGTGSGGTTATATTYNTINSTTMATITTADLVVTVGSGGRVDLSAPLTVSTAATGTGAKPVFGIWQWDSTGGGVWVDLGTEVQSNPDCVVDLDTDTGFRTVSDGLLSVTAAKTGLAASSSQKFRLQARNGSGTKTMNFAGTSSAVGS